MYLEPALRALKNMTELKKRESEMSKNKIFSLVKMADGETVAVLSNSEDICAFNMDEEPDIKPPICDKDYNDKGFTECQVIRNLCSASIKSEIEMMKECISVHNNGQTNHGIGHLVNSTTGKKCISEDNKETKNESVLLRNPEVFFNTCNRFKEESPLSLNYELDSETSSYGDSNKSVQEYMDDFEESSTLYQVEIFCDKFANEQCILRSDNSSRSSSLNDLTNIDQSNSYQRFNALNDHNYMLPRVVTPIIQSVKKEPFLDLSSCLSTLKELSVYHKSNGTNQLEIDGSVIDEIINSLQSFKKTSNICITPDKSPVSDIISNVEDEPIEPSNKNQEKEGTVKKEEMDISPDDTASEITSYCDNPTRDDVSIVLSQTCSEPMEYIIGPKLGEIQELRTPETIENLNETKFNERKPIDDLIKFGRNLITECENFQNENDIEIFTNKILKDFKDIVSFKECRTDSSTQTTRFESKKKINEKEKTRLLASSASESSSNEDEDDDDDDDDDDDESEDNSIEESSSIAKSNSPNSNLSEIENEEESNNEENVYDSSSDCDGLDLAKYVQNDHSMKSINDPVLKTENETLDTLTKASETLRNFKDSIEDDDDDDDDDRKTTENKSSINNNELEYVGNCSQADITTTECNTNIPSDEKLKMKPVVVMEKLTDNNLEVLFDEIRDKEIDRLLDFESLLKAKPCSKEYTSISRTAPPKSRTTQKLLQIIKNAEKDLFSEDSSSEGEEEQKTEKDYLSECNKGIRDQLVNSSGSDSEVESNLSEEDKADLQSKNGSDFSLSDNSVDFSAYDSFRNDDMEDNLPQEICNKIVEIPNNNHNNEEEDIPDDKSEEHNEIITGDHESYGIKSNTDVATNILKGDSETIVLPSTKNNENLNEIEGSNSSPGDNSIECIITNEEEETSTTADAASNSKIVIGDGISSKPADITITENPISDSKVVATNTLNLSGPSLSNSLSRTNNASRKRRNSKSAHDLISLSSDSDPDLDSDLEDEPPNRSIKAMLRPDQLAGETKLAQKRENERTRRLDKKQQVLAKAQKNNADSLKGDDQGLILDYNSKTKKFIKVHPEIVKHLKPHQKDGVKFMYDCCYGSVEHLEKYPGSGCILAHCMGLGKTLQLIALLHTVIDYNELNTAKVLVLCPKSTVMNWGDEIQRWLGPLKLTTLRVFFFADNCDIQEKIKILQEWSSSGKKGFSRAGCLLVGYEAFRNLVFYHLYKKQRATYSASQLESLHDKVKKTLLEPGADLVICDEGHIIKNRKSAISQAVAKIKTSRRIVLTGTPIQNNLKEYYSMVDFIKPSFLGTEREFGNLYANPIKTGQHKDSSKQDIKVMKQRSFVLHKKLSKFVQRREAALLKTFLPDKYEYVLFVPLTEVQINLYEYFLRTLSSCGYSKGKSLITDYTCLRKIWTHPKVLENAWQNANSKNKKDFRKPVSTIPSDDEVPDDVYDSQTGILSVTRDWWRSFVTPADLESVLPSNKLRTMFEILRLCAENGDKCLIFSAFVAVLNVVEHFMKQINCLNNAFARSESDPDKFKRSWIKGQDYYRLDGKTPKTERHEMVKSFNNPLNRRARCFLISAKAGGQGINLIGANRVIILDTSWNPSNDQQNIFRIFRMGQKKKCYVYRIIAMGTMEEKVYSRSVTKQAMSFRVVDEQQIDRHYSMAELAELYTLSKPDISDRPVPVLPQDSILASLLRNHPKLVYKYHEHDSLLENKLEQELSEQEKADAWEAYEQDVHGQPTPDMYPASTMDGLSLLSQVPNPLSYFQPQNYPGNFPMGYRIRNEDGTINDPLGPLAAGINYAQNSAIMEIYNMYNNFSSPNSSLLSNLNQPNMARMQQPYMLPNPLSSSRNKLPAFNTLPNMTEAPNLNTSPSCSTSQVYPALSSMQNYRSPTLEKGGNNYLENYSNMLMNPAYYPLNSNVRSTHDPNIMQNTISAPTTRSPVAKPANMPNTPIIHDLVGSPNTQKRLDPAGRDSPTAHIIRKSPTVFGPAPKHVNPDVNIREQGVSIVPSRLVSGVNMGIKYPETVTTKSNTTITPVPNKSDHPFANSPNITVRTVTSINSYKPSENNKPITSTAPTTIIPNDKLNSIPTATVTQMNKTPSVAYTSSPVTVKPAKKSASVSNLVQALKPNVTQNMTKTTTIKPIETNPNLNFVPTKMKDRNVITTRTYPNAEKVIATKVTPTTAKLVGPSPTGKLVGSPAAKMGQTVKVGPTTKASPATKVGPATKIGPTTKAGPITKMVPAGKIGATVDLTQNTSQATFSKSPIILSKTGSYTTATAAASRMTSINQDITRKLIKKPMEINKTKEPSTRERNIFVNGPYQNNASLSESLNKVRQRTVIPISKESDIMTNKTVISHSDPKLNSPRPSGNTNSSSSGGGNTSNNNAFNQEKSASMHTLETINKYINPQITIVPGGRKIPDPGGPVMLTNTNKSIEYAKRITAAARQKEIVSRKRPATPNIMKTTTIGNSTISQIKKFRMDPSQKKSVTDSLRRIQISQDLTILPKGAKPNNQINSKSGKPAEVVEID